MSKVLDGLLALLALEKIEEGLFRVSIHQDGVDGISSAGMG